VHFVWFNKSNNWVEIAIRDEEQVFPARWFPNLSSGTGVTATAQYGDSDGSIKTIHVQDITDLVIYGERIRISILGEPKSLLRKTAGVLKQRLPGDHIQPVAVAVSGTKYEVHGAGALPVLQRHDLPTIVKYLIHLLKIKSGNPNDAAGVRGAGRRNRGRFLSKHVEVMLMTKALLSVLRSSRTLPAGVLPGYRELIELRDYRLRDGLCPSFEVHITRDPCYQCSEFARRLSNVTGICFSIKVGMSTMEDGSSQVPKSQCRPGGSPADGSDGEEEEEEEEEESDDDFENVPEDIAQALRVAFAAPPSPSRRQGTIPPAVRARSDTPAVGLMPTFDADGPMDAPSNDAVVSSIEDDGGSPSHTPGPPAPDVEAFRNKFAGHMWAYTQYGKPSRGPSLHSAPPQLRPRRPATTESDVGMMKDERGVEAISSYWDRGSRNSSSRVVIDLTHID
jgi:hypothetical protein